jgi:hypothetical protein
LSGLDGHRALRAATALGSAEADTPTDQPPIDIEHMSE